MNTHTQVRRNAVASLGGAERGNMVVLVTLRKTLSDSEGGVREASVKAIAKIAQLGDMVRVRMCVCMYVCMYVCVYIYVCICVYVYVYIYIHGFTGAIAKIAHSGDMVRDIHICMQTYIHNYVISTLVDMLADTDQTVRIACCEAFVYVYTHVYIHTYIHVYINTCIHTYVHTYIHT
jgi:hypothetical protein